MLNKDILKKIVLTFFSLSILLDLHTFYNSISTLIRLIFIVLIFIIVLLKYSTKKEKIFFISYFILIIIYSFLHDLNCVNFNSLFENNFNYTTLKELLYISKMTTSVLFIYIIYKLNIKLKDTYKYLTPIIVFITLSIILGSILKIGYSSYNYEIVKGSIIDWFKNNNYNFMEISCKGWFQFGNQVSALLLIYFPIQLYYTKEKANAKNVILCLLIPISLMIIGTRISTYLGVVVPIICLLSYIITALINKQKFNLKFIISLLIIIIISIFLFEYSPLEKKKNYYNNVLNNVEYNNKLSNSKEIKNSENQTLYNKLLSNEINKDFFENRYSYKIDPAFWENILKLPKEKYTNVRYVEEAMTKRVIELNNNKYDNGIGIGYSRIINIFNIEKDYVMQYYSLGIIGTIIFLFQYPLILLYLTYKNIRDIKSKDNCKNVMLLLSLGLVLTTCYFSGNILNSINMIIPISLFIGISLNEKTN